MLQGGDSLRDSLFEWSRRKEGLIDQLSDVDIPAEALPFIDWVLKTDELQKDIEADDTALNFLQVQNAVLEEKVQGIKTKLKSLKENAVYETLQDEIYDLAKLRNLVDSWDYDSIKPAVQSAVRGFLHEETILTRKMCELEECSTEQESTIDDVLDLSGKLAEFQRMQRIQQSLDHVCLCASVEEAKARFIIEFKEDLFHRQQCGATGQPDYHTDIHVMKNELSRVKKKLESLQADLRGYLQLRKKLFLRSQTSESLVTTEALRQRRVSECMLFQGTRYHTVISIIKNELKCAKTVDLKMTQISEAIDECVPV